MGVPIPSELRRGCGLRPALGYHLNADVARLILHGGLAARSGRRLTLARVADGHHSECSPDVSFEIGAARAKTGGHCQASAARSILRRSRFGSTLRHGLVAGDNANASCCQQMRMVRRFSSGRKNPGSLSDPEGPRPSKSHCWDDLHLLRMPGTTSLELALPKLQLRQLRQCRSLQ